MQAQNVMAFISSRWHSTRLPGKSLIPIGNKPLLRHVVDRLQSSSLITKTIVVTTDNSEPIIEYCKQNGIEYFVSSNSIIDEENLLHRYIQCGDKYNADIVIRIWGDCPFLGVALIEGALKFFIDSDYDYFYPQNLTKGLSFALYRHTSFVKLYHLMSEGDKWHWNYVDELRGWQKHNFKVCLYDFKMTQERLRGLNINTTQDLADARLAVDKYGEDITYKELAELYGDGK